MSYLADPNNWIVATTTLVVVFLSVGLHFEVLSNCHRLLALVSHRRRPRVLLLIIVILLTHVAEIWLFAFGYYFLVQHGGLGALTGAPLARLPDYTYFSAVVYTTVGFGDVIPTGAIRFMAGMEALTGIVMITWSASFTSLEMARDWPANRQS
jgi:Ion channel